MYAFEEKGFGNRGDGDEGGGVCKAFGVALRTEDSYGVGGRAESFHAFVGLLAVVQGWCHAVKA